EVKKAGATPTSVAKFTNFTVNLGDETAGLGTDDDIFYMGSAKVKSSSTSAAPTAGTPVVTQGNVTEIGVNYIADNVQVNTGRGNDSVVYGGAIIDATTKLTATEIKNTKSNLGTGSDSVAFNQVQAIGAGNVVDLGFDTDVDTINFVNYSGSSNTGDNKFGATSLVTINNFGVNDVLVLGGVTKTGKADAQAYINSQGLSSNIVIT
ncbi:MAG: hypothetical protein VKI83_01020, partial [Synechococcaceae cyanobacterium]|nr:hypothetical protein [Synechococcaceae cyanobacterium]